jgi:hypothetical protein
MTNATWIRPHFIRDVRRSVNRGGGGGASINVGVIICPLVQIGLTAKT